MRILIDILHPAHVHVFRNLRAELIEAGHDVIVTARDKDLTLALLDRYAIPATTLSTQGVGRLGMARELITRVRGLRRLARKERPDVLIGIMGPAIAPVGRLLRIPSLVLYDTEHARATNRWVFPMATRVITPAAFEGRRANQVTYPGYHELAYLHPDRFTPDPGVLRSAGLSPDEPFSLVRFVSWQASHDTGRRRPGPETQREIVERLGRHGRVLISAEGPLPADLEPLRLTADPVDIHHLLAHARVIAGDSGTMSSEAAMLGVPAVYVSDLGAGVLSDQQNRWGLLRHLTMDMLDELPAALETMAGMPQAERTERRSRMLDGSVDTTTWLFDYITRRGWEELPPRER